MTMNRRDFLRTSAVSAASLSAIPAMAGVHSGRGKNCIFLMLVGGPSQLDTWDPKPDAPSNVRGPYRPIPTRTPGLLFTELFPKTAAMIGQDCRRALDASHRRPDSRDRLAIDADRATRRRRPIASAFRRIAFLGERRWHGAPANVLLPGPIGFMGVNIDRGQSAGELGVEHAPVCVSHEVDAKRDRYGASEFGDNCLRAARLIESGSRFVTVNMFESVYDTITWDCHAAGGSLRSELSHYKTIGTMFDTAYAALIHELDQRGLLDNTLVVATGEFGRTPYLNRDGGRDHWAGVWTALLAGGGVRGGQVIGSSDRLGGEPNDCPVRPEQFAASIRHALGLPSSGEPIRGLFA